jgi:hypothetical protein
MAAFWWEEIDTSIQPQEYKGERIGPTVLRASVPGGWFVYVGYNNQGGVTFYPDPDHRWDGRSAARL